MGRSTLSWYVVLAVALGAGIVAGALAARIYSTRWAGEHSMGDAAARRPLPVARPGSAIVIAAGQVTLEELTSFLGDATGLNVLLDASAARRSVAVASTLRGADPEVVRVLLEASGFRLEFETLPSGSEVLRVRGPAAAASQSLEAQRASGRSTSVARRARGARPRAREQSIPEQSIPERSIPEPSIPKQSIPMRPTRQPADSR